MGMEMGMEEDIGMEWKGLGLRLKAEVRPRCRCRL